MSYQIYNKRIEKLDSSDYAILLLVWGSFITYSSIMGQMAGSMIRYSCFGVGKLHDPQIWRVKKGDYHGCRKAIGIETGDIQGAFGVFMETEAVVDDSDDRCARSVWPSSHLYSEFSRGSVHLYFVLNATKYARHMEISPFLLLAVSYLFK